MPARKWDNCPLCGGGIHYTAFCYVNAHQVFAQDEESLNWEWDPMKDHIEFTESGEWFCSNDHSEEQMIAAMLLLESLEADYDGIEKAWHSYHAINPRIFE